MRQTTNNIARYVLMLFVLALAPRLAGGVVAAENETGTVTMLGDGTSTNPYQIETYQQLLEFADLVNKGQTSICAVLTADITTGNELFDSNGNLKQTLPEENQWTPIVSDYYKQYTGTFDGQGHTISGLYVNDNNTKSVGVFGNLSNGGIIRNVGVKDSYFYNGKSGGNVGGVCGYSEGTIENCYNERTTVSGTGNGTSIGGVCGNNNINTIKNCYNIGDVSGGNNNYDIAYIGGVCGSNNNGTIENCYNAGNVIRTDYDSHVGEVCGSNNYGTIENCYYPEGTANSGIGMDMNSSSSSATHLPKDDFKNGKVAWLLNGNGTQDTNAKTSPWLQNLSKNGGDQFPVLKANTANDVCPIVVKNGYSYKNGTEHSYVNNTFADFPDYGTANLYSHVCDYCKGAAQESPKKIKQLNSANDADIVITKAGDNWTTSADITLGDNATNNWYHAPVEFTTTGTVTHTRAISTDWVTLCLPYEISTTNANCKFYKLSNVVPSEKITLTEITGTAIEAGTPVFVKRNDNNVNSIKFTASNVEMIQTPTEQTADNGKLVGTFNTVTLTMDANGDCLFIKNNNMWSVTQANKDMTVKPFRAYIVPDTPISAPKLSIAIDGEATAISDALDTLNDTNAEYYDINGRRISSLQKGVNIIKSGNRTRKVIIK